MKTWKQAVRNPKTGEHEEIKYRLVVVKDTVTREALLAIPAADDIVRRGGQRGIGCTMISQRSAVLNKNVLTQIEVLIALKTMAPQDLKAIDAWIDVHGTEEERKTLKDSLPSLPVGDAWVWSPGWPTADGIFKRIHVGPITTFDSGATPKPGEKRTEPRAIADVDLEAVRKQMADVVERAAASDPKALQAKVRALERELKNSERQEPAEISEEVLEQIREDARKEAQDRADELLGKAMANVNEVVGGLLLAVENLEGIRQAAISLREISSIVVPAPRLVVSTTQMRKKSSKTRSPPKSLTPSVVNNKPSAEGVSKSMQKILDELATLSSFGIEDPPKAQIALLCGYSNAKSGGFAGPVASLREMGLIEYFSGARIGVTSDGIEHAAPRPALTTAEDLQEAVIDKLGKAEGELLRLLIEAYPEAIPKKDLAAERGYSNEKSGGFAGPMGRLKALSLIDYPRPGEAAALPVLFP